MKASKVVELIPAELREYARIFIDSEEYTDQFAPPQFVQDIVWLAQKKGSTEISDKVLTSLTEWLDSREDAFHSAMGLVEALEQKHPVPTPEQAADGASLPPYITTEWFRMLRQVWSHKHAQAVEDGWKWLANH